MLFIGGYDESYWLDLKTGPPKSDQASASHGKYKILYIKYN